MKGGVRCAAHRGRVFRHLPRALQRSRPPSPPRHAASQRHCNSGNRPHNTLGKVGEGRPGKRTPSPLAATAALAAEPESLPPANTLSSSTSRVSCRCSEPPSPPAPPTDVSNITAGLEVTLAEAPVAPTARRLGLAASCKHEMKHAQQTHHQTGTGEIVVLPRGAPWTFHSEIDERARAKGLWLARREPSAHWCTRSR